MINVILCDDHQIIIDGLRSILQQTPADNGPQINVIGEANNGHQLLDLLAKTPNVDMIVLDIGMEGMDGIDASKIIKEKYPQIKILILSMHDEKSLILRLMNAGIDGYILKEKSEGQLIHAITQINGGNSHFGLGVLNSISKPSPDPEPEADEALLTNREIDVLRLIGEGHATKEISTKLDINETTVNTHKRNLRHKLDAPNEKHLVRYAIKHGYATV